MLRVRVSLILRRGPAAGCSEKLLRKDVKKHMTKCGAEHGLLLAQVFKDLSKENKVLERKYVTLENL